MYARKRLSLVIAAVGERSRYLYSMCVLLCWPSYGGIGKRVGDVCLLVIVLAGERD